MPSAEILDYDTELKKHLSPEDAARVIAFRSQPKRNWSNSTPQEILDRGRELEALTKHLMDTYVPRVLDHLWSVSCGYPCVPLELKEQPQLKT